MPKGGSREGAGRPRGSRGKRTAESVAKAEALGPTPLEVLLESMLAARAEGERAEAVDCAKAAAPYVHSKLAPTSPPRPSSMKPTIACYSMPNSSSLRNCFRRCSGGHRQAKSRRRNLGQ